MHLTYSCPGCQRWLQTDFTLSPRQLECDDCNWSRPIPATAAQEDPPKRCLICGCEDLWRQKDFPQKLGLTMVALGAVLSTIFWAQYMVIAALGVLLAFALVDLLLYTFMKDVLACYRCGARYRRTDPTGDTPYFNLEVAERYRQEALRLQNSRPLPAETLTRGSPRE